jgi:aspartate/methionine/tyrosine aminotransferase
MMFREGPYRCWDWTQSEGVEADVIDQVNFSRELFIDPLPLADVASAFDVEAGYGTSDGALELSGIIRGFEWYRASEYVNHIGMPKELRTSELTRTSVAVGSGVTGSLSLAIGAIEQLAASEGRRRDRIYYSIPGYGMVEEIANAYKLRAIPIMGERADHLPSLEQLEESFDRNALAYVLTYPTNPAQSAYDESHLSAMTRFIALCQEHDVFLIVDTIFQDLAWSHHRVPEVLALVPDAHCIVKTFGPSKDRPFACGLRIGYMIGDARLQEFVSHLSSVALNSANFYSKLWLALDLTFRQGPPTESAFDSFEHNFLLGNHCRKVERREINERARPLFEHYRSAGERNQSVLREHMNLVIEYLRKSPHFALTERPAFGNTVLVRLADAGRFASDYELFAQVLFETNVGVLVGAFFGVPETWGERSFRIVIASEPAEWVIERIARIERLISH